MTKKKGWYSIKYRRERGIRCTDEPCPCTYIMACFNALISPAHSCCEVKK